MDYGLRLLDEAVYCGNCVPQEPIRTLGELLKRYDERVKRHHKARKWVGILEHPVGTPYAYIVDDCYTCKKCGDTIWCFCLVMDEPPKDVKPLLPVYDEKFRAIIR